MNLLKFILSFSLIFIFYSCNDENQRKEKNEVVTQTSTEDSVYFMDGVFDIPELNILSSPDKSSKLTFSSNEKVIDYDVSPAGRNVAILTKKETKNQLQFWEIGNPKTSETYLLPDGFSCNAVAWHPFANALFVMGSINAEYKILRIEKKSSNWTNKCIYKTSKQLSRLVTCPRPFITGYDSKTQKNGYSYRIFFGMENKDKSFRIVSITEFGNRFYQVIGPAKTFTTFEESEEEIIPSELTSSWALPIAFHPAGHKLIWEDKNNNFNVATYDSREWGVSKPINGGFKKDGSISPTPNGLGLIHWQKESSGIGISILADKSQNKQLVEHRFISKPSSVPDGKGIVGLTIEKDLFTLNYLPIHVPLADVYNAWMYIQSKEELNLFQNNFGLFRPNHSDQLYKLYETENYYCNSYDKTSPTRPYLVTTDIFWELFSSAYQGLFIVKERDEAIPNFWQFIDKANAHFKSKNSKWSKVFKVLEEFEANENSTNQEIQRMKQTIDGISEVTNENFAFSELKPRGHYTSTLEMKKYFMAFKYFTSILANDEKALAELEQLPNKTTIFAKNWIQSYSGFIAPSRSQLVWKDFQQTFPAYCKYPKETKSIFPSSWGFDNEILFSTVYHQNFPENKQIKGPGGLRILPSGLDIASVFGNQFAENLLRKDFEKYPPLKKVINNLRSNYSSQAKKTDFNENFYNKWLNTLSVQWADTVSFIHGQKDNKLWQAKRLQTGLASWATLRHATVLVNERGAAECGEGGFEEILMRAPRGYVEPDPYTFAAIATLFDDMVKYASKNIENKSAISDSRKTERKSLYEGIILRLKEAAQEAKAFQKMAEKERKGIHLTNEENEKILSVARVAEHLFLIFNSLSNNDYALSNPDPISKISDVFGDGNTSPYLMAAVGNSIEWNHIVPFYGRKQIVKGAVYSYYEFESRQLLNDEEWRKKVKNQEPVYWIKPYITKQTANNMASSGY
jgi:hypothetical protein